MKLLFNQRKYVHPLVDDLKELPAGFTTIERVPGGLAMDYIRGNLFAPDKIIPLPHDIPGPDNDLNEKIDYHVQRAMVEEDAAIYAFCERWGPETNKRDKYFGFKPDNGIYDIHMNQGSVEEFKKYNGVYTSVRTEDILRKRKIFDILTHDAIYDTNPLWSLLNSVITQERYQRIIDSLIEVFITTVNLQTGHVEYLNQHQNLPVGDPASGEHLSRQTLLRAILASASEPVLMPNVRIKENGDQYVDGGEREIAPLKIAVNNGATRFYAIVLSPEKRERKDETYGFIVKTFNEPLTCFFRKSRLTMSARLSSITKLLCILTRPEKKRKQCSLRFKLVQSLTILKTPTLLLTKECWSYT